jgi:hypothetical protein
MMRRVAAGLLFAALVAGGVRPALLRLLLPPFQPPPQPAPDRGLDRAPLRWKRPFVRPDMEQFLEQARAQTRPGERLGLQFERPYEGFGYAHWRASYALTGRYVLIPDYIVPRTTQPDAVLMWNGVHGSVERPRK